MLNRGRARRACVHLLQLVLVATAARGLTAASYNASDWDSLLRSYVTPNASRAGIVTNLVDYAALASDVRFQAWIDSLAVANMTDVATDRSLYFAFWINAYNSLAAYLVATNQCKEDAFGYCGPTASIRQVGEQQPNVFASVWKMTAGTVGGVQYSLDDIEQLLRQPANLSRDPRIHSAIVCASLSCPNLQPRAFLPESIDATLNATMAEWLGNPFKGFARTGDNSYSLSPIFQWFASDFTPNVSAFILPFVPETDRAWLASLRDPSVAYFDYDWDLNGDVACPHGTRPCCPGWALLILVGVLALTTGILFSTVPRLHARREIAKFVAGGGESLPLTRDHM
jgi:hypothetical protein